MKLIPNTTIVLLLFTVSFFAQSAALIGTNYTNPSKLIYLDSVKKTFVIYKNAVKIDSLWRSDLTSLNSYDQLLSDIKTIDLDEKVDFELPTALLKQRLKDMDSKIGRAHV